MLSLRKPESSTIRQFLDGQSKLNFTYHGVGTTATQPPKGYVVDHTRAKLGSGDQIFISAKSALQRWQQFRLGWLEAWSPETPIQQGEVVAVIARSVGVWWLNACRIVYVIEDDGPLQRFGFAYGTLPDHAGSGEERFLIEINESGDVWYDILAFSRPQHVLARLGYPFVRVVQKRFGKESAAAMIQTVQYATNHHPEGNVP
jgi:uncharacterized protein (UPF0548 family)